MCQASLDVNSRGGGVLGLSELWKKLLCKMGCHSLTHSAAPAVREASKS